MWIVAAGEPIHIACPTSLTEDSESNLSISTSATGRRRANYFGGFHTLRTWAVDHSLLTGAEKTTLEALALGGFGTGDLGFIPTGAEHQNLFTPAASLLATVKDATRRITTTAQGISYPSGVNTPETALIASRVPFPYPGDFVVVSVVARNSGGMSIRWLDATGQIISYQGAFSNTSDTEYRRVIGRYTAPANAAYFDAHVKGDVAAPALTLGNEPRQWAPGQVAKSIVVSSPKKSLLASWDPARILSSANYQIMEVGSYE